MPNDILILGAGLAGLSCAHHLRRGYTLLEGQDRVGGVARSFERDGFVFDMTGHWLHLRDDGVKQLVHELLGDSLVSVNRRAAIYSHGRLTSYPFQAHAHGLPLEVVSACVTGFLRAEQQRVAQSTPEPENFEQFIRQRMGDGIAEHFMIPYNTKIWGLPPAQMSHQWCGRFVPIPTTEEVVLGALYPEGAGRQLGYNTAFVYPRQGIGELAERLHAGLSTPAITNAPAREVDWQQKVVRTADGTSHAYASLVSTLPLDLLIDALVAPPDSVREARAKLRSTTVTYWDIGLRGANAPDDPHWIYFPESHIPFYRAGSASASLASLAPADCRSLYVEVSHPRGSPCPAAEDDILTGLRTVGLLEADREPLLMHRTTLEGAYVVMDEAYGDARATCLDWLQSQGIVSIGRYGAWTYDSMEGAILQGKRAAAQLLERKQA